MIVKPKIVSDSGTGSIEVRFLYLDIEDGKLVNKIVKKYCNSGGSVTPPNIPTSLNAVIKQSCALNFHNWNITNLTNIQHDLDVGALYNTADGKTHAFVLLNSVTGLSPTFYFSKSDTSELTISWGDGTSDYTTTSSGNLNTSHTYATAGNYEIKMWISSGNGTYTLGYTSVSFHGDDFNYKHILQNVFIGENITTIPSYGFYNSLNSKLITISRNVTSVGADSFGGMSSLEVIVFPNINSWAGYTFQYCYSLYFVSLPSLSITSLPWLSFQNCRSLQKFIIPDSVTTIDSTSFQNCYSFRYVNIPATITNIGSYAFSNCMGLKKELIIPSTTTSLDNYAFEYCNLKVITIKRFTAPSTITTLGNIQVFTGLTFNARIYVPVGSLSVYQNATNWSTYANRMYEDTPENRDLFGD